MTASEQARADALADAETLLGNLPVARIPWDLLRLRMEVTTLSRRGLLAALDRHGQDLARAAFRAVPGLRGDR